MIEMGHDTSRDSPGLVVINRKHTVELPAPARTVMSSPTRYVSNDGYLMSALTMMAAIKDK
jgi:hypothetical protein